MSWNTNQHTFVYADMLYLKNIIMWMYKEMMILCCELYGILMLFLLFVFSPGSLLFGAVWSSELVIDLS